MSFERPRLATAAADALTTANLTPVLNQTKLTTAIAGLGQANQSLLFIDGSVADYQQLVAGAAPGTEIHVLDPVQDAVTQITNVLLGRDGISSLHIVSHGEAGGLDFGTGKLNLQDLPEYAAQLQSWSKALTDDADILLYGCNIADGELGKAFTSILSQLTGADVAASDDLTGSASKGGNWTLEVNTGEIGAALAFRADVLAGYQHILPVDFVSSTLPALPNDAMGGGLNTNSSNRRFISSDGRYTVFTSTGDNLAPNDSNGVQDVFVQDRVAGTVSLVSINSGGTGSGNNASSNPVISANGRYVAFDSGASNLVGVGGNQVYVRDLQTGTTVLASRASGVSGAASNNSAANASLSDDGRYVAFLSSSPNLSPGDTNFNQDIFVRDLQSNTTVLASPNSGGTNGGNSSSFTPLISGDGQSVVFTSSATDLTAVSDTNSTQDIFRRNLVTNTTQLVSINSAGTGTGSSSSDRPVISSDGRYVAFHSNATNLTSLSDTNGNTDVFLFDAQTSTNTLLSVNSGGTGTGSFGSFNPSISADGRYIAFQSNATNLSPLDTNTTSDIYVRDRVAGTFALASLNNSNSLGNQFSGDANISANGRYVTFLSSASNLSPGDTNTNQDIFVRDLQANTTVLASPNSSGTDGGNSSSLTPIISADGQVVVFATNATNLTSSNDFNGQSEVVLRHLPTSTTNLLSRRDPALPLSATTGFSAVNSSQNRSVSVDGRYVVFTSIAGNLVSNDSNLFQDVFVRDTQTGTVSLVSVNSSGTGSGNSSSSNPVISANGRYVAFDSSASNLVTGVSGGQIYVRDLSTGTTVLASRASGVSGAASNNFAANASLSDDGRYVAFLSSSTNLSPGDTNFNQDIFVRDLQSNTTVLASPNSGGTNGGNNASTTPLISGDGQSVVFTSSASDLTAVSDINGTQDIFRRNLVTNTTQLVSINSAGTGTGSSNSFSSVISSDGRYVAFNSNASNLTSVSETNGTTDVFLFDAQTSTNTLLSVNSGGTGTGNNQSSTPSISADGRYIAFQSNATNLSPLDTNNISDIYVRDRVAGTVALASLNNSNSLGNQFSSEANISADGRYVTFLSSANNLTALDTNGNQDVFVRDLQASATTLISRNQTDSNGGNRSSSNARISANGQYVLLQSLSTDLVTNDLNGQQDVFGLTLSAAPTITLPGGTLAYTENAPATFIDPGATALDTDSPNLNGGFLRFLFAANGTVDDRLAVLNQGTGTGEIGVSGSTVTYNFGSGAVVIGSFTGGSGTTPLLINFTASATPDAAQALMRNITYANVSENPSALDRTLSVTLSDGSGGSTLLTKTISVTAVDDLVYEVINTNDSGVGSLRQAILNANVDSGTEDILFNLGTGAQTIALASALPFFTDSVNVLNTTGATNLTIRANGQGISNIFTVNNGVTASFSGLQLVNANDGISNAGILTVNNSLFSNNRSSNGGSGISNTGTIALINNSTFTGGGFGIFNSAAITTIQNSTFATNTQSGIRNNSGATITTINNSTIVSNPIGIFNTGTTANLFNSLLVNPTNLGGNAISGQTGNLVFSSLANAGLDSTLQLNGGSTPTYALLPGSAAIDAAITGATTTDQRGFATVNSIRDIGAFESRGFSIAITGGDTQNTNTGTTFSAPLAVNVTSSFSEPVTGGKVTYVSNGSEFGASASFSGNPATIDASGNASATPTANNTSGSYTVNAGGGGFATPVAFALTNNNVAPVLTFPGTATLSYAENDLALLLDTTATVTDTDSPNFNNGLLNASFTAGGDASDRLEIRNQGTDINQISVTGNTINYNFGSGVVAIGSFTGGTDGSSPLVISLNAAATPLAVRDLIRNLTYRTVSENPTADPRTVSVTLNDGAGGTSTAVTKTINVTANNDAPVVTVPTLPSSTLEDTPLVFSTANNNAISITDLDAGSNPVQVSLTATNGTITLGGTTGLTGLTGDGSNSISFSGTLSDINTALQGLTFASPANVNGAGAIAIRVNDQGNSGGTAQITNGSVNITITPVNDAPQGTSKTVTAVEDSFYAFAATDFGFSDPNDTPANGLQAVLISTLPTAGSLTNNNVAVNTRDLIAVADITSSNLRFTPASNANGAGYANFTFRVQDDGGTANSGVDTDLTARTMTVNVTPVNDAPQGTSKTVTTLEDTAYVFSSADFGFSDPTDIPANSLLAVRIATLPSNGTLTNNSTAVGVGDFVAVTAITSGQLQFTPAANANGTGYASFTFQVQDNGGTANSGVDLDPTPRTLTVNVTPVNDAPQGTNKTVTLAEDGTHTFTTAEFGFSDPNDIPANSLQAVQISALPTNGTLTNNSVAVTAGQSISAIDIAGGLLTFTPAANANGTGYDSFTFRVQDDGATTNGGVNTDLTARTMTLDVTAVNDAPSFTKGADQTVNEDAGAQAIAWATALSAGATNESSQTLSFQVSNDNNLLFTVQPTIDAAGRLTYTPAANANGTATVTVRLQDNGGTTSGADTSAPQTFIITVNPVNDIPSFTKGADQTVNEDAGVQSTAWATNLFSGATNESSQTFSFLVSNSNNALFEVQPTIDAAGALTYKSAVNANGIATVAVQLKDNGGTANGGVDTSTAQTFAIAVTAVNDAPSFTPGANQTALAGSGAKTIANWVTAFNPGAPNETSQTALAYTILNVSDPSLFTQNGQPAIAPNGTLTYTPVAAITSATTATISVQVQDSGGTANTGVDTSTTQTFTITVNPVNNRPSFTATNPPASLEDGGLQTVPTWAIFNPGNATESAQTPTYTVSKVSNTALFTVAPTIATNGDLSYTAVPNASGTSTFDVVVKDNGGTANGGIDTSTSQTFTLTVTAVNDAPTLTGNATLAPVVQGTTNPSGSTLTSLLTSLFTDVDTGARLSGVALVGNPANSISEGQWQYSLGTTWFNVGSVGDDATALALAASTLVRFVPAPRYNGTPPGLSVRALDNSYSGGFTTSTNRVLVDTTTNGGSTALSGSTPAQLNTSVTPLLPKLLWRNGSTGENAAWALSNFSLRSSYFIPSVSEAGWQVVASTADFNGDGIADLLWRNNRTGENTIWQLNNTGFQRGYTLNPIADLNWQLASADDFNQDGSTDLLWRNNRTGENVIWQLNNFTVQRAAAIPSITDVNWQLASTANFSGDSAPELLWRNSRTGENVIWQLNNFTLQTAAAIPSITDVNWQLAGTGNFNGDGSADLVWRNLKTGENVLWQLNGLKFQRGYAINSLTDVNWQLTGVADLGGDGTPELLWRNRTAGQAMLWQLNGFSYSQSYSLPSVSDPNWGVRPFVAALPPLRTVNNLTA